MPTLGELHRQTVEQVRAGEKHMEPFASHALPEIENAAAILRESLVRVVAKAKQDFTDGIVANSTEGEAKLVASYVPRSEPSWYFLTHGCQVRTTEIQKIVDEVWSPFLSWLQSEGLGLFMASTGMAYGVEDYVRLEAVLPEEA